MSVLDARLARTRRALDLAGKLRSGGTELTPARFLVIVAAASARRAGAGVHRCSRSCSGWRPA